MTLKKRNIRIVRKTLNKKINQKPPRKKRIK